MQTAWLYARSQWERLKPPMRLSSTFVWFCVGRPITVENVHAVMANFDSVKSSGMGIAFRSFVHIFHRFFHGSYIALLSHGPPLVLLSCMLGSVRSPYIARGTLC